MTTNTQITDGSPLAEQQAETYLCDTPHGPAELSVVNILTHTLLRPAEAGRHCAIHGHRVIVRSRVTGREDVYGVFESSGSDAGKHWRPVTDPLTASQLSRWPDHRKPGSTTSMHRDFDAWLRRLHASNPSH